MQLSPYTCAVLRLSLGLAIFTFFVPACGGLAPGDTAPTTSHEPLLLGRVLPNPPLDPGYLPPPRTTSAGSLEFDAGSIFDFTDNGETGDKGGGTFAVLPGGEDDLDSAWVILRLQLAADDRPVSVDLGSTYATLPGGEDDLELSYWLGAYSFSQTRWDWLDPPPGSADPLRPGAWSASGVVPIGMNSEQLRQRFCNLGGDVFFCVLVEPKSRAGEWCGVTVQPSTLNLLDKSDPAYFRTAPLGSGTGAATGDSQNGQIDVQVGPDPAGEADRIYVQRRESSGTSSARQASTADWLELGFTDGAGGTYTDPDDNLNSAAGDPQEGVAYEYRTVAAVLDGNQSRRAAPSVPVSGSFGWTAITVYDPGSANVGQFTSMAVVEGHPAIAFADASNSRVLFIRASDPEGTAWPSTPEIVATPAGGLGGVSLAVVGPTPVPAIAFYAFGTQQLNYVFSGDSLGDVWGTPFIVDFTVDAGHDCDLKLVGGVPCIAYADGGNGLDRALRFVRASNPLGTGWQPPEVVYTIAPPDDVQDASLAEVGGQPAIAFYHSGFDCLSYVRFDGSLWPTPDFLFGVGVTTCNPSLVVNSGAPPAPLISYAHFTNGLFCIAATDTQGGAWGTPFQLDPGGAAGEFCSMSLVNGKPAVAYRRSNHQLVFVESATTTGTLPIDWGTPKVLDGNDGTSDFSGMYSSLIDLNGRPAISYYSDGSTELRYARLH
jgi:hypothetical protein